MTTTQHTLRQLAHFSLACVLSSLCLCASAQEKKILLPELGDSVGALTSDEETHNLGQEWLRQFRAKVPESNDAVMYDYLQKLIRKMADSSDLTDKRIELIVVKNPTLNAFAVPGGIMGIHDGMFLYAENEQQLAGVIAHELGHLSQKHWQRSVEQQQQTRLPTMAGMLAGLVLLATSKSSDAGMAAIMSTQAAYIQNMLRFSRENEAEADRVGMQTMVNADMDPRAIPAMFESMQRAAQYAGDRPPEFLLTHPVTEKRIADSRNRAEQYPAKQYKTDLDYALIKARARLEVADNPSVAIKHFQSEMNGDAINPDASRYGIALAQTQLRQFDAAQKTLKPLYDKAPDNLLYALAQADILNGLGQYDAALALAQRIQTAHPHNYPATLVTVNILENMKNYPRAVRELENLLPDYEDLPTVWHELAELRGLAGDTGGVHTARAEYFILNGEFDKARQQLTYALNFYRDNRSQSARVQKRLQDITEMESNKLLDG
ncbi:MAG TPA: M48 family metalloprotease [Pseudomonadales bacterium]|jgi:predicted Zn-dependent protease|nr:M48 family metalloprotease [Pseudomonadales bacterium]HNN87596.1 M48 family metalloprotease [Pseudomonadales bacterium]